MSENYRESFEKTRSAGIIAAGALDEVAKIIKPNSNMFISKIKNLDQPIWSIL